jgi:hypothetical protein
MSFCTDNPADLLHLFPRLGESAREILPTRNDGCGLPPCCAGRACSTQAAIVLNFLTQHADENFALACLCRLRIPPLFGHRVGAFSCALRQLAPLLRLRRPPGYGFPPNLVRKNARKDFSGPSANAGLRHLGAWPTRSTSAPTKIGKFHKRRHSCTRTK